MNIDRIIMSLLFALTMMYILWINYELTAQIAAG